MAHVGASAVHEEVAVVEAAAAGAVDVAAGQAHGARLLVIPLALPTDHAPPRAERAPARQLPGAQGLGPMDCRV